MEFAMSDDAVSGGVHGKAEEPREHGNGRVRAGHGDGGGGTGPMWI